MTGAGTGARLAERDEAASGAPSNLLGETLATASRRARSGPAWLDARRAGAVALLERKGFPGPKDEAFRFTPLSGVLRVPYADRALGRTTAGKSLLATEGRRIRLDGGRPDANAAADDGAVEVSRIADLLVREPERLEPYLGVLAAHEHGFVAQNTALFTDGVLIRARAGSKGVLHLEHVGHGNAPALATPRVVVIAEPGSELSLVESLDASGEHLLCAVMEVYLGTGAILEHIRVARGSSTTPSFATVAVEQRRDSRYASRVFTLGGRVSRLDLRVALIEPGAECVLDGLYLAGPGDVVDHHTTIEHASPRCASRERYKGVLDADGLGIFDGTIVVRRGASGTEAHQENRNLLLSNDAVVHAKPHLEIDTDDVRCSHGATVGRLDPAQLFYLRSRGIDAETARSLLTYAFAREMVLSVGRSDVRTGLEDLISSRLPSGAAVRELA